MSSFLQELKDRHVIKAGIAFLAVAWLIIQLIGEIGPMLGAPDWIYKAMLVLLAAGFVVTVILAWVYELTNKGLRRAADFERDDQLHTLDSRKLDFVIIGALILALGYFVWESRYSAGHDADAAVQSIAVLPFRDMSANHDQEYFAEGMAEELINALSRIPDLKVAGRTSSFAYKNQQIDLTEIADQLGVSHILEGSVRTSGTQLRVTAQLVNAEDGFQVWTREFDRELSEIFSVQDEISSLVIDGLKLHLGGGNSALPSPATITNLAAYDAFLLGRYYLARRTAIGITLALEHFKTAIDHDQTYSRAYSGLAMALVVSPYYMPIENPAELALQARAAAEAAIELDDKNGEGYSTLGIVELVFDRNWARARDTLRQAVELQPNDAGNNNLYGDYLYVVGDYQSARRFEGLAAQLEPLSAVHQHDLAIIHYFLGDLDRAIELEKLAIALNPEFSNGWQGLARNYLKKGNYAELQTLLQSERENLGRLADRLEIQLSLQHGDQDSAERIAREFFEKDEFKTASDTGKSYVMALLGDDKGATDYFELAYANRDPIIVSPLYFFIPEDWPDLRLLQNAMNKPDLARLYDLRRRNIAAGTGRNPPQTD
jgi:adenylate cyclase